MSLYYYICASLPMLVSPDQTPPLSSEEFFDNARPLLSSCDYESLEKVDIDPQSSDSSGISGAYRAWEMSLRNQLVILRAKELSVDSQEFLRTTPDQYGTAAIAAAAMAIPSPLEAELFLDSQRWQKIDELSTGHFFDMDFLRGYRLKLQIIERHQSFEEERGFTAYRNLYARVLSAAGTDVPMGGIEI